MSVARRFILAVFLLAALLSTGTPGYSRLEGWPLQRALCMSVITMSTVGFREVEELSSSGEWFTIVYILLSILFAGFAAASITAFIVQGELTNLMKGRRMNKKIENLKGHYILCGCGALARIG